MSAAPEDVQAATAAIAGHLRSSMVVVALDLGHRTGLFEAMAGAGPLAVAEVAERAGCDARNVEEWLGVLATAGVVAVAGGRFQLPDAWAAVLTGPGVANLAPQAGILTSLAGVAPQVAEAMRTGAGLGYDAYRPGFTCAMDQSSRARFDEALVDGYLSAVDGLVAALRDGGGRCLDVGCGTGHATVVAAAAFPGCTWVGLDLAEEALEVGRGEATELGLANASFVAGDAGSLPEGPWDLVTMFDALHDQVDPVGVLSAIRGALAPDGLLLVVDIKARTGVEQNLAHPMGPWVYGVSLLHCLQVSLAGGGPGLGAAWGREQAVELLASAGFEVDVLSIPQDRVNLVYACRRVGTPPP